MLKPIKVALLFLLFSAATASYAQEFGGNPPSIKLKQVKTPVARVIYPEGLDSAARRVLDIVTQMNKTMQKTIGSKQKQINIVLQNQTTVHNAYVGLAPFRSEFYLTPDQNSFDIGSLYWPDQLAIHEFRHVQQYNNFNVGFSHVLRFIFGEGGQAFGNGVTIPDWFFEGDAVYNETHVSEQGRGRLPYFFNGYRGLWMADRNYGWQKLRNGSYLDYTPDWYPTGYMLVSYGREKYGEDFWKNVTHDAASFRSVFYPLQKAIKRYSGVDFQQFRTDALNHFKQQFSADVPAELSGTSEVKTARHFDADREYPAFIDDSTLVYVKTTYDQSSKFVIKKGNTEKVVRTRDYSLDNYFAYHNGMIVYPSYRSDARWGYRDFSELNVLNVNTGQQKRITSRSKYFAPDFSADGRRIVAVDEATSGKCEIHILDANTGKLISVVPNTGGYFYTYPKFYGEDKLISAVRTQKGEIMLAMVDIKSGHITMLVPLSYQPVGFLKVDGDEVYFTATSGKEDRLFRLSLTDHKVWELQNFRTAGAVGNYQPATSSKKLAWVGFTDVGYQIINKDKLSLQWKAVVDKVPGGLSDMGIPALRRDSSAKMLDAVADNSIPVTKYSKSYHLFNFHSLIPSFDDPDYNIALTGENVINTFQSQLGFLYNRDEGYKQLSFDVAYGALYPYILGGVSYTFDRNAFNGKENVYWNETNGYVGLEFPFNFSRGRDVTQLTVASDINYSQANFQQPFNTQYRNYNYAYEYSFLTFSHQVQKAKKNIFPRFAQAFYFNYRVGVHGLDANQYLASGSIYLPGLLLNHSLVFSAAHQERGNSDLAPYSNDFPFSRGYQAENLHTMNKLGVNYHLPIAYPDAGAFNTVYLLRLRTNFFYDYTHATQTFGDNQHFGGNFRSTGAELYFDTKWFNNVPVSFGVRYSRLLDEDIFGGTGRNRFELIVPVAVF